MRVARTVKIGATGDEAMSSDISKEIEVLRFPPGVEPAHVYVEFPLKKTANYNSAGLTVGIDRACYAEEIPDAAAMAFEQVKEAMMKFLPEILQALTELTEA
jgi:hypothetical protein